MHSSLKWLQVCKLSLSCHIVYIATTKVSCTRSLRYLSFDTEDHMPVKMNMRAIIGRPTRR